MAVAHADTFAMAVRHASCSVSVDALVGPGSAEVLLKEAAPQGLPELEHSRAQVREGEVRPHLRRPVLDGLGRASCMRGLVPRRRGNRRRRRRPRDSDGNVFVLAPVFGAGSQEAQGQPRGRSRGSRRVEVL